MKMLGQPIMNSTVKSNPIIGTETFVEFLFFIVSQQPYHFVSEVFYFLIKKKS